MRTSNMVDVADDVYSASPIVARWNQLCDDVRHYAPDVVVLVARKMPRLFDALQLELGENAICVSDQALPFMPHELSGAKVAVVDDVWNFGSTMTNARTRVVNLGARMTRLFALGAKDAPAACAQGVHLGTKASLHSSDYRALVESAPRYLRSVPKPYDGDFPILASTIRAPYANWSECWAWLRSQPELAAHETNDDVQLTEGRARATVNLLHDHGWTIKVRLYFDFRRGTCNVVPMALAPSLPLRSDYPEGSLAEKVFETLSHALSANERLTASDRRDAFARANTFCDSLMHIDATKRALGALFHFEQSHLFSTSDFSMQFGPAAAKSVAQLPNDTRPLTNTDEISEWISNRGGAPLSRGESLTANLLVSRDALDRRDQLWPAELVLDALVQSLATAVGADTPSGYALTEPYTRNEILEDPYLRLRIGFTFNELIDFFSPMLVRESQCTRAQTAFAVGALLDLFVDFGAIVPTISLNGDICTRIYRKGESNPKWDEEAERLKLAVSYLRPDERADLVGATAGRTRLAKIVAIMSYSAEVPSCLRPGALERGTVGMLRRSVVERSDEEFTHLLRRTGILSGINVTL